MNDSGWTAVKISIFALHAKDKNQTGEKDGNRHRWAAVFAARFPCLRPVENSIFENRETRQRKTREAAGTNLRQTIRPS